MASDSWGTGTSPSLCLLSHKRQDAMPFSLLIIHFEPHDVYLGIAIATWVHVGFECVPNV